MSKIALSGNASGTGTFTIASPNSNSDRTLNLPDNSGTVATSGTSGVDSVPVGRGAGNVSTNTAVGASALAANTTGANNTSVGQESLLQNTGGSSNTATGRRALYSNTTGINNTATGREALNTNTTGESNTAVGRDAIFANTTGSNNTAVGLSALQSNTTASFNTAVGYQAGFSNTTGAGVTYVGDKAGYSTTGGSNTFVGDLSGYSVTTGAKNTIIGRYDGNQGGLDIRTASNHIVLSDGDGNPRGIFDSSGNLLVGKAVRNFATTGLNVKLDGDSHWTSNNQLIVAFNRLASDGLLIEFAQDNTIEGSISVSGTTVSYNGGHLSRWAQTTTAKDESLVKGTVLSNLDEMNVYVDADGNPVENEQLNKVKVSDVEGDANVAGVFVNWDYDKTHNTDEINMAMTGDMIIRIAQGVTVQRGDLLMSAGDGTAKPQGDDIVRSKTIAKVTSTHVTCTYADGSYCVPCVLMAC
jgi:hypothetical protein